MHPLCIHSLLHAIHKRHTSAFAQHPPLSRLPLSGHSRHTKTNPMYQLSLTCLPLFPTRRRDLSASDKQRHTLCIRSLSHAVSCPRVRRSLACCMAPRSHHRHALCLPSAALSLDCIAASFQIFSPLNRHPSLLDTGFGHMTLALASVNALDSMEPCNGFVSRMGLVLSTCLLA